MGETDKGDVSDFNLLSQILEVHKTVLQRLTNLNISGTTL